jgi:CubicO group peptidase (beta-lactamase class C family)
MEDFQPGDVLLRRPIFNPPSLPFRSYSDWAWFGLLYLRHGHGLDKQIVPEARVEQSSHANEMEKATGADAGGYEYLWWVD